MAKKKPIVQPGEDEEGRKKKKRCSCVIFDNSTMGVM